LIYGLSGLWTPDIESIIHQAMDGLAEQAGIAPLAPR